MNDLCELGLYQGVWLQKLLQLYKKKKKEYNQLTFNLLQNLTKSQIII